jgi:ubiquinone/menaquinone biosynthesis C-methylase UbiE
MTPPNAPDFFEGTGMPDPGWWEALWPDPATVIADVGVTPDANVVDLCSGDGWFTLPLARLARSVIAVDIDGQLLKAAMVRIAERGGAPNCTFVEGNAYDLGRHVIAPVDHVFLANAFHGVPDKSRLSRAVHDVLKPAGLFAVVNWHARPREETTVLGEPRGPATAFRITPQVTIDAIEPSGFKLRHVAEVSPYHYGAVFERKAK